MEMVILFFVGHTLLGTLFEGVACNRVLTSPLTVLDPTGPTFLL